MTKTSGMWATVATKDNLNYEGIVSDEQAHGLHLWIGGDVKRLVLFPWGTIDRVIYKAPEPKED